MGELWGTPFTSCGQLKVILAGEDWTVDVTWTLYSQVFSTARALARPRVRANEPRIARNSFVIAPPAWRNCANAFIRAGLNTLSVCGTCGCPRLSYNHAGRDGRPAN